MFNQTFFHQLRRFPYQSLSAIFLVYITFFLISIFSLFVLGAHSLLNYFQSRPQVTAFFQTDVSEGEINKLKSDLESQLTLSELHYINQDEALSIYRSQNADNPLLLEMVTADILPASLEVSTRNASDLELAASILQKAPKVEEVVFQKDIIDALKKWVSGIRLAGIALSSLLLMASLVTVILILGLKFTARKAEIKTLRLLGATTWYIRAPFIKEGIFYATLGSVLGWGSSYLVLLYLTPNLLTFFQGIPLLPVPFWVVLTLFGSELTLALTLGIFASLVATRRFVR